MTCSVRCVFRDSHVFLDMGRLGVVADLFICVYHLVCLVCFVCLGVDVDVDAVKVEDLGEDKNVLGPTTLGVVGVLGEGMFSP